MSSEPLRPTRVSYEDADRRLKEVGLEMCGGAALDDYLAEFRAQGETQCTNVWSKGVIAYRCRTCQTNDSRYALFADNNIRMTVSDRIKHFSA